ncbi:MAG TPA: hypothetical protein VEL76_03370, partial [Gemmataceae bacterium]|nr:hypothetical protein [Gemmataceae bacterium]
LFKGWQSLEQMPYSIAYPVSEGRARHIPEGNRINGKDNSGNRRAKWTRLNGRNRRAKWTHPSRFCSTGDFTS